MDVDNCWDTLERTLTELETLELEISTKFNCQTSRQVILDLDAAELLDDSPVVSDWRATYARYTSWLQENV